MNNDTILRAIWEISDERIEKSEGDFVPDEDVSQKQSAFIMRRRKFMSAQSAIIAAACVIFVIGTVMMFTMLRPDTDGELDSQATDAPITTAEASVVAPPDTDEFGFRWIVQPTLEYEQIAFCAPCDVFYDADSKIIIEKFTGTPTEIIYKLCISSQFGDIRWIYDPDLDLFGVEFRIYQNDGSNENYEFVSNGFNLYPMSDYDIHYGEYYNTIKVVHLVDSTKGFIVNGDFQLPSVAFYGGAAVAVGNEFVTDFIYAGRGVFFPDNGCIVVIDNDNKRGVIDRNGDVIVSFTFEDILLISGNRAFAKVNGRWGIIGYNENEQEPPVITDDSHPDGLCVDMDCKICALTDVIVADETTNSLEQARQIAGKYGFSPNYGKPYITFIGENELYYSFALSIPEIYLLKLIVFKGNATEQEPLFAGQCYLQLVERLSQAGIKYTEDERSGRWGENNILLGTSIMVNFPPEDFMSGTGGLYVTEYISPEIAGLYSFDTGEALFFAGETLIMRYSGRNMEVINLLRKYYGKPRVSSQSHFGLIPDENPRVSSFMVGVSNGQNYHLHESWLYYEIINGHCVDNWLRIEEIADKLTPMPFSKDFKFVINDPDITIRGYHWEDENHYFMGHVDSDGEIHFNSLSQPGVYYIRIYGNLNKEDDFGFYSNAIHFFAKVVVV
jgi:hypothetical protein